jgi:bifunctional non-homologous end joining protein LigD
VRRGSRTQGTGHGGPASDQLRFALSGDIPDGAASRPIAPRIASEGPAPFDDPDRFFEPWWPGATVLVHARGGNVSLRSTDFADPSAAFPELAGILGQLAAEEAVLEGTLMVLDDAGRPDARLLRERLREPGPCRGEGALVISDLLVADGVPLMDEPFTTRRARLLAFVRDERHCVVGRGLRGEGRTLAHAVAGMGIGAISARRFDAAWRPGPAGDAWLRLPLSEPPAGERKPLLVLLRRLPLD